MKSKRNALIFLLSAFLLTACNGCGPDSGGSGNQQGDHGGGNDGGNEREGDDYDTWANSWSKPGHLYFHYNRGLEDKDYNNYCLWLWQHSPLDLEGGLWGYDGPTKIKNTTMHPMTTSFMTLKDVGLEGNGTYQDKYGVIFDVDLYRNDLIGGKTGKTISYEGADTLGFLLPVQSSMDGTTHWKSDGGSNNYIEDFDVESNWRSVEDGEAIHVFVSTGALDEYVFYVGNGTPEVKFNPVDKDTTGNFRSVVDNVPLNNYKPKTSDSFKEAKAGYQVMVSSFRDSNGDGIGDLHGVIDSLGYFEDLGVDTLWLTPIQQSDSYHGYDISDYYAVDKRYGTIEDYRELIYKAHEKGIKVLMDLVLNHTSKSNVWYQKSKWAVNSGVEGTETDSTGINWRNVYTWKYATDKIRKPNVVKSGDKWIRNGYTEVTVEEDALSDNPSWYRDGESNYYYYGKFGSSMPEINYENLETRKLVIDMAKYWMSFGLDGFRLDAVKHIYMADEVEDVSGDTVIDDVGMSTAYDDEKHEYVDKLFDYSSDQTKNVNWWKEFSYELKSVYPNCFLVGENFDGWGTRTSPYYDALDSQFDFSNYYHVPAWIYNGGGAGNFTKEATGGGQAGETYVPFAQHRSDFINGAFTSNHDVPRLINQANGTGNHEETKAATVTYGNAQQNGRAMVQAAITLLNPGLSWIYYGDELGMSSNTDKHVGLYGNENCMDIWYRQPFLWSDSASRPNYSSGQYKFELDDHNKTMLENSEGVTYDKTSGAVTTTNAFYKFYKDVIAIKQNYPKGAKCEFTACSDNILTMHIYGGSHELMIYINTGLNTSQYLVNPGAGYSSLATINGGTSTLSADIGNAKYSISAFIK